MLILKWQKAGWKNTSNPTDLMLSISKPMHGAGQGNYYLGLAREDYYLSGGEPPGLWHGEGASRLGLSGVVEPEKFRNLLNGFSPDRLHPLAQNAGRNDRQSGWDLTFSAPKSVSVLWALSDSAYGNSPGSQVRQRTPRSAAPVEALLWILEVTYFRPTPTSSPRATVAPQAMKTARSCGVMRAPVGTPVLSISVMPPEF